MKYNEYKYLYPPRPEVKIPANDLYKFDNGEYIAQPKYNGSCYLVFTNGDEVHVCNRHKEEVMVRNPYIDWRRLARSNDWYVFSGEYLNKGKYGENNKKEVDKFVIWDVLVWQNTYLTGTTTLERISLLETHFPCHRAVVKGDTLEMYQHLCNTDIKGIYKAPTYMNNFEQLYRELVKVDLYEGLLLKKATSKLSFGFQEKNNTDWQIKCRKETKIYNF